MYLYFQNSTTSFALFPLKSNGLSKPMVSALPLIPSFLPCRKENPAFVTESHLPVSPYFFRRYLNSLQFFPEHHPYFFYQVFTIRRLQDRLNQKSIFCPLGTLCKISHARLCSESSSVGRKEKRGGSPRAHLPHNPFISGSVGFYVC